MVTRQAYLGDEQRYGRQTSSGKLSGDQVQALNELGIYNVDVGMHFEKGLITARTRYGVVNIRRLHQHIVKQLSLVQFLPHIQSSQDVHQLLTSLQFLRQALTAALNQGASHNLISRLRTEQSIQYSQLGTMMLPHELVSKLQSPVLFVENTAQRIGKLVELTV